MSGHHNKQKFKMVGVWISRSFLDEIEKARGEIGRSQFLREALKEKLSSQGIFIKRDDVVAPDRGGKGGRPVSDNTSKGQRN